MPGNQLLFHGTTGPGGTANGQSQPDRSLWLGRFRASETLHSLQSTLTATQTLESRHYLVDSARIGDGANVHALKWLLIQTGPAALSAARVMAFNSATGTFKLDRRTSANAATGNSYALFNRNNVWPDVTAQQAGDGQTDYRCIVFRNGHAASLTATRLYFVDLGGAHAGDFSLFCQVAAASPFLQRSNGVTDLFDAMGQRELLGGSDGFSGSTAWLQPFSRASAIEESSVGTNTDRAIWLRRRTPAGIRFRRSVAILVIADSTLAGSDPDPLKGAAIMAWDVLGTPQGSIALDRRVAVGGGARLTGTVRDATTQAPITGVPVKWQVQAGDDGSVFTDNDPLAGYATTDEDGRVFATFTVPTTSTPGELTHPELVMGAGEEVGDP